MNALASSAAMQLGASYATSYALHDQLDKASFGTGLPGASVAARDLWIGHVRLADAVMLQPPSDLADVQLQLAMAASWAGPVIDAIPEESAFHDTALAINTALENATLFLNRMSPVPEGLAAGLIRELVHRAKVNGGETAEESPSPDRAAWDAALATLRALKAANDGIDQRYGGTSPPWYDIAIEAEALALDNVIENVPAPDGIALALKVVLAMTRAEACKEAIYEDHAKAIFADARRLAGDA